MTNFGTGPGKAQPLSRSNPGVSVQDLVASVFAEDLVAAAGHGGLTEALALALLQRRDLPAMAIEALARNQFAVKHRKVLVGMSQHSHTPRHIVLPVLRRLFAFELLEVAIAPSVAADVKLIAEELLINKIETLSLGERISLARRASSGVAGALLHNGERAVIEAALQNPRMTEANILKSFNSADMPQLLLAMISEHPKWSLRREIQIATLRRKETSDALVARIAARLPKPVLYELLKQIRFPERRQELLRGLLSTKGS